MCSLERRDSLKALVEFIKGIAEAVTAAIDFLFGIIEDLVYMVKLLSEFILQIPVFLSWLPPAIVTIFVTIFSIVVIYKVIGREG